MRGRPTGVALLVAATIALILVAPAACSHGRDDSLGRRIRASLVEQGEQARKDGSDEISEALEDGVLTDAENDGRAGKANVAVLGDCLSDGMREEYPEIEGFSWGPPDVY